MTTHSDTPRIEPYWFGRPEAEIRAAVDARPEQWAPVPGYSKYLWSDKGRLRPSVNGEIMKTRVINSGYEAVKVVRDRDGKRVDVTVHQMVLLAHHPAFRGLDTFPAGLETRHNPVTGPLFNAYPEGLWPGTKAENVADKNPEGPQFPCRNAPQCQALVFHEGRRCPGCVAEVGRQAAVLLEAGMNLADVARHFGYTRGDWTYRLAVKHGGYGGTREQALTQRLTFGQRVVMPWRRRSLLRRAAAREGDAL